MDRSDTVRHSLTNYLHGNLLIVDLLSLERCKNVIAKAFIYDFPFARVLSNIDKA